MPEAQDQVTALLEQVGKGFDTGTVFGETRTIGDAAIIPVARIGYGGGGGGGAGPMQQQGGTPKTETGEGSGVGFGIRAQPLGVVEVRGNELRWKPVIDWGRLLTTWAVIGGALMLFRMMGRRAQSC